MKRVAAVRAVTASQGQGFHVTGRQPGPSRTVGTERGGVQVLDPGVNAVGRVCPSRQALCRLKQKRLLFARSTMWHLETQERQLQDVWKSVREEAAATGRCLRERTAKQLRQETEAAGKAERNQLLRVRWVPAPPSPSLATSSPCPPAPQLNPLSLTLLPCPGRSLGARPRPRGCPHLPWPGAALPSTDAEGALPASLPPPRVPAGNPCTCRGSSG